MLTIALHQAPVQLPGITVSPVDASDLIRRAIDKVGENYPTRPFVLTGFYRAGDVYKQKVIEISEALFTIYSPDNQRRNMQFRLIRARADRDLSAFDGNSYSLGRKPDNLMDRDMVSRIHETQILGDEGRNDNTFSYGGLIDYEGQTAYEIRFDQKDQVAKPLYKGRIIIDTATLAFLCFDYGLSPKGLAYLGSGPGPWHNKVTGMSMVIRYRRYGAKYYLHHVRMVHWIKPWYDGTPPVNYDTLVASMNYVVTRIDTGFVAYSRVGKLNLDKKLSKNNFLSKHAQRRYTSAGGLVYELDSVQFKVNNDKTIEHQVQENAGPKNDDYWENYNSIEADYNVDSALAVIRRVNEAWKKRPR
jgi:hypothetical protein